jgi:DNA polymerase III delta prime subunit
MSILNNLLIEQLRPKTLDSIILLDRIKKQISEDIPQHLLLTGAPGTGKTSLVKILSSKYTTKFINASSDARIDILRDSLEEFCSTKSLSQSQIKIVVLDEIDYASSSFFAALRPFIEKYKHIRFLATANYENKIPDAIYSRFLHIKFEPLNSDEEKELMLKYSKHILNICKQNNLKFDSKNTLKIFIEASFPDLRSLISKLQSFIISNTKEIKLEHIKMANYSFENLYKMAISTPNSIENFKIIMSEYSNKVSDVFYSFSREFPEFLENKKVDPILFGQALVIMAKYEFQSRNAIDPVLHLLAMIFELQNLFLKK